MITTINEFKKYLKSINENKPQDLSEIDLKLFPGQKDPDNLLSNMDHFDVEKEFEKQQEKREKEEEEESNS